MSVFIVQERWSNDYTLIDRVFLSKGCALRRAKHLAKEHYPDSEVVTENRHGGDDPIVTDYIVNGGSLVVSVLQYEPSDSPLAILAEQA